ncbi:EF-hand calcium-binding domain-containing protein 14 isoform X2 [Rana temporaria]|uniref:EF-hand calcium-binding domain-containing protein 14 isoform X2 n=1 Tax=Rana temporaria TaxID=8407 RepID=UPI001AAC9C48|nr:EF-hand calcium-binding domain-containing protein 14 isoform X2 [Rana temporaria]
MSDSRGSGRRNAMGSGALSAGPPPPSTPHKKMKKRKELNALIGLSGDGKKKGGGGHHPLLRAPDSESDTDTEDYGSVTERPGRCGRGGVLQCCKVCSPVCAFIFLAACVMASIGLVWMQIALKENLDLLREQMRAVESNQRSCVQEIPKMKEDLIGKQKQLDDVVGGELGLHKLWANITDMNKQISQLSSAVSQLKANLKSASDLINLPKKMEELQKSVATLGSTLTSVHHDVETLQTTSEEQKKLVEALQKDVAGVTSALSPSPSPAPGTHSTVQVENSLEELNSTILYHQQLTDLHFLSVDSAVSNISQRVSSLESNLLLLNQSERRENVSGSNSADGNQPLNSTKADSSQNPKEVAEIQEQLQLIHALTTKPDGDKATSTRNTDGKDPIITQSSPPKKYPRSPKRKRRSRLSSATIGRDDLEEAFRKSSQGVGGKLTFQDLKEEFGVRLPGLHSLEEYDEDGDGLFSLTELRPLVRV